MQVISNLVVDEDRRRVVLRITSNDQAPNLKVQVTSDTEILSASVFGERLPGAPLKWQLAFTGFPPSGAELELELPLHVPLRVRIVEQHLGLPVFAEVQPRPGHLLPEPNTLNHGASVGSEQMLISRSFSLLP